jgi:hypothetical protein
MTTIIILKRSGDTERETERDNQSNKIFLKKLILSFNLQKTFKKIKKKNS